MGRVKDWIMDMNMFVEEAIWESGLRDIEEILEDVKKNMHPQPIDAEYIRDRAKKLFVLRA